MKSVEFVILNGQKSHTVRFQADDRVVVDGTEWRFNAKFLNRNQCSLFVDDTAYSIDLVREESSNNGIEQEMMVGGRTFHLRPQDSRTRLLQSISGSRAVATGEVAIRAPMPGLVGRILTRPGARLSPGEGIMILEAMKMENEIRCPSALTVKEIKVTPGQGVDKNQLLAVLSVE